MCASIYKSPPLPDFCLLELDTPLCFVCSFQELLRFTHRDHHDYTCLGCSEKPFTLTVHKAQINVHILKHQI